MNPRTEPTTKLETIDSILAADAELVPSSGFLSAVMERVHEEAAAPAPIPFPWRRAVPGLVLIAAVYGWGGFELARSAPPAARTMPLAQLHLSNAAVHALVPAGWVAFALAASLLSWLYSRRLAGRSGLL
ncbi:MAG: hypothetical protein WBE72_04515 [Terracidiphilus sp.]